MTLSYQKTIDYLKSNEALKSIERDPYWPKWDSPWWHMLLLSELGCARDIPISTLTVFVAKLKNHYLPIFPIFEPDLPAGTDPITRVACHCAIGSVYQVLLSAGVDVDSELPWMRPWFLKYQLADGGLNCDDEAYRKLNPKSSIVSTLPCLEAILFSHQDRISHDEKVFLKHGAQYLLRHKLFRSEKTGKVIDPNWCEVRFPRFYQYDFLRGFYFLAKYREISGFCIPDQLVDEVEVLIGKQLLQNEIFLKRYNLFDKRSYNCADDNTWSWGQASEFDLMKEVSAPGLVSKRLSSAWEEVRPRLATVIKSYEQVYKNPIVLTAGEIVKIEKRETNPAWPGWIFCRSSSGIGGWVHEKYLIEQGEGAIVFNDYNATELSISEGETIKLYYCESGWWWGKNSNGKRGWVPNENLQVL